MSNTEFPKYGWVPCTLGARKLGCTCEIVQSELHRTVIDTNNCQFHYCNESGKLDCRVELMRQAYYSSQKSK